MVPERKVIGKYEKKRKGRYAFMMKFIFRHDVTSGLVNNCLDDDSRVFLKKMVILVEVIREVNGVNNIL